MMRALVGATCLFCSATFALASDFDTQSAPTVFNWSGGYAGVHIGYGWGESNFLDREYNVVPQFPEVRVGVDSDGLLGGIQAGYNWQAGSIVIGAEAEVGYLDLEGKEFPPPDGDGFPYDTFGSVHGGWYAGLSARLGFAFDHTLIYAKAGGVYSGAKLGYDDVCTTGWCGPGTLDGSERVGWGYQVGGGVEHAVTSDWTLKAEYAYFDFGNSSITAIGGATEAGNTVHINSDLTVQTVKLGANYKF